MRIQNVCVLGGTGFVGGHLVARLAATGRSVRVLTRRRERHKSRLVCPTVDIEEANVFDPESLDRNFSSVDAVIFLAGILNESRDQTFKRVHVDLPRMVSQACARNGVRRLLHMSALNASADRGASEYLQTKGEGEDAAHLVSGGVAVTSFRPSVIFGPDDSLFNRFASMLRISPVLPLACPQARFKPVYVGDVADAFVTALENAETFGTRLELCGPEEITLVELVKYIARLIGVHRVIVPLGAKSSRLLASVLQYVPGKPMTPDNYRSLQVPSICTENGFAMLGLRPKSMDSVMPLHFQGRAQRRRYTAFRRSAGRNS